MVALPYGESQEDSDMPENVRVKLEDSRLLELREGKTLITQSGVALLRSR